MFRYELHCHTSEVSACARVPAKDVAEFYASRGYAGIFITDHFICGQSLTGGLSWEEKVDKFCSGYEAAKSAGEAVGLKVFFGFKYTRHPHIGADFLVYGLERDWLVSNPKIIEMGLREGLEYMAKSGAFIVHAHPFRESSYIEMIRLLPRQVHGVEVINANRGDIENKAAEKYADYYCLYRLAGTDNHLGGGQKRFCGIETDIEILIPSDLRKVAESGGYTLFDEKVSENM